MRVQLHGLDALRRELARLSARDMKRAVYGGLDDVARDATVRLAERFRRDIEGGPVRFTEVRPDDRRSSVVNNRARRDGDAVSSSIRVQRKQARYLAFGLGEDDVRTPGEAGFSTVTNLTPTGANGSGLIRMARDAHGNVTRASFRRVLAAVKANERADAKAIAKKGGTATPEALKDARRKRAAALRKAQGTYAARFSLPIGAKADRAVARAEKRLTRATDGLFLVKTKRPGGLSPGVWQRDRLSPFGKPRLILASTKRIRYPKAHLVAGWNESVTRAGDGIAEAVARRLAGQAEG